MGANRRFRALSLDLWFTTLYYPPERDDQWTADRAQLLSDSLETRSGSSPGTGTVQGAIDAVHARFRGQGREPITVDPEVLIPLYVEAMGARLTVPLAQFARTYSAVGLAEHPPTANPEAIETVRKLSGRHIPVIAITNSARRGRTWQEYLRERMGIEFRDVISSCDCGAAKPDPKIFWEAARRAGLAPSEILHVGDRWELDVEGALRAGFGAALYRGLWRFYPEGEFLNAGPERPQAPEITSVDRLDEVIDRNFEP